MSDTNRGTEYHVSTDGDDGADGGPEAPFRTVSAAAERATPGDTVTIHDGTYRERVDPPRGGTRDARIVYRAAAGADPVIKGSEVVDGWERRSDGLWERTLPNAFFDGDNPFDDPIAGHWFDDCGRDHHRGFVACDDEPLPEAAGLDALRERGAPAWHAAVADGETTLRARFGTDPADATIEVAVRPAVFYPSTTGIDRLSVRGLTLRHAATQWAPPTTEQVGIIGTNWSEGWVIEGNEIDGSRCVGLTLGFFGDWRGETPYERSAEGYKEAIRDALDEGWERGSVGGHTVRDNEVRRCGQAGIVGSMGSAFSEVVGNHVHHNYTERAFDGAEMAGIKFHGPIDTTIAGNRIHHSWRGIWLDWMTQGTRTSANLLYANDEEDLYTEVNHGPFVVDNNLLLSDTAIHTRSQGGAHAHNLIAGDIDRGGSDARSTPYHVPGSTEIAGAAEISGGDDRYHNNVFAGGSGLRPYDDAELPVSMAGNVFLNGAEPPSHEDGAVVGDGTPNVDLAVDDGTVRLSIDADAEWTTRETALVTGDRLGTTAVSEAPFTDPNGDPIRIDRDYFGDERGDAPTVGPIERLRGRDGRVDLDVWPR